MELSVLLSRMRTELGDPLTQFRDLLQGDGQVQELDLSKEQVQEDTLEIVIQNGADTTPLNPGIDYTTDAEQGKVYLTQPLPNMALLVVMGSSWDMFSDDDLITAARDAVLWHCQGRYIGERYLSYSGFIQYRKNPITLTNLPPEEELPLVVLAVTNVFWTLANDSTTDVNVDSAEGTNINRSARYMQIMQQIQANEARYQDYCAQLNIGKDRIEVMTLRRVSRTTGRLVPLYAPREYDAHEYPTRELPPVDVRYEDNSGIPSQVFYGGP